LYGRLFWKEYVAVTNSAYYDNSTYDKE
jgi:hypothetical protein